MPADTENLHRRIEEASLNAWPATHQLLLDGWLIRFSGGFTKRANCVVPLYSVPLNGMSLKDGGISARIDLDKIRFCENLYAREQLQTVFRLTSHEHDAALDRALAERGYERVDNTQVQLLGLAAEAPVEIEPRGPEAPALRLVTTPDWLQAYAQLAGMPAHATQQHAHLIRSIRPECAFALLEVKGTPVACALGVLEHDLFGLFDVVTARDQRGKGFAELLLRELLRWGSLQGARLAYLQVISNNASALSLYQKLGFEAQYTYWYRLTP